MAKVSKDTADGISKKERKEKFSKIGFSLRKGKEKDKLYITKNKR